jgi:predicted GNAT family N-acyltransferase
LTPDGGPAVTVRPARDDAMIEAAQRLRVEVFCDEQGVPREIELDGSDQGTTMIVALDDEEVIGTCRLRFSGETCTLERMAVQANRREEGVGWTLLAGAEDQARRRGASEMHLKGQLAARGFYERGGYSAVSEEVIKDAGIDHVAMQKAL